MVETSLVRERLLSSPAFMRDLKSFLSLPENVLLAISELGNKPEGFVGRPQAQSLNNDFDVPVDKTIRDLRIAEYLYDRVTELGLNTADAVNQIVAIASELEEPISIDNKLRDAIEAVLSFKRDYEISGAKSKSVNNVPHFVDANGSWSIKPIRTREGEIVRAPVMTMSIVWHDSSGNPHEAFFHMADQDWNAFSRKMNSLADSREEIEELL